MLQGPSLREGELNTNGGISETSQGMDELLGIGAAASRSSSSNGLETSRYQGQAPACGAGTCVGRLGLQGLVDQNRALAPQPPSTLLKPLDATVDPGTAQTGASPSQSLPSHKND